MNEQHNSAQNKPKTGGLMQKLTAPHMRFKEQEYFIENLALLMKSAVPMVEALTSLAEAVHQPRMKKALVNMAADIEAGYNLTDALERSHLVGGQTLALVRLGESSGHLVENLQLAAQQEEKRHMFRAKIRSALLYPAFVLTLTLVVGLGVAWFLLPKLAATFGQLRVHLPLLSRVMISFGVFLKAHGLIAVPLALLVLLLIGYVIFAAPQTKWIGQRILFVLPGVGRLMREVEVAQFGYLLGTLLDAGLSVTQAMQLLARASGTLEYSKFYQYLAGSLDDGYSFKDSITRYGKKSRRLLPGAVQQMVVAGERSGSLPEVLLTVGRTYEQKADITTSNLEAIIEPVLLVIVSVGVLLVAIAVIIPIYSLVGGLNQ